MINLKIDKRTKRNPLDDVLSELKVYSGGISSEDLRSSGE